MGEQLALFPAGPRRAPDVVPDVPPANDAPANEVVDLSLAPVAVPSVEDVLASRADWTHLHADASDVLDAIPEASLDAIVSDPPYGLSDHSPEEVLAAISAWCRGEPYLRARRGGGFMGSTWDTFVPGPELWRKALRALKPGGIMLVFAGTRTQHLMGTAIALAGFEILDTLAWLYGQGMPKVGSMDLPIDRRAGHRRGKGDGALPPVTDEAKRWEGWSPTLKPALEPIIVARKPFRGTLVDNLVRHGTGALHVDACRVRHASGTDLAMQAAKNPGRTDVATTEVFGDDRPQQSPPNVEGRFPPNVVLGHAPGCTHTGARRVASNSTNTGRGKSRMFSLGAMSCGNTGYADEEGMETVDAWDCVEGCPAKELGAQSGESVSRDRANRSITRRAGTGWRFSLEGKHPDDEGTAARYFPQFAAEPPFRYVPKASPAERDAGCEGLAQGASDPIARHRARRMETSEGEVPLRPDGAPSARRANTHPCVKPIELLRWLVRLVARPGAVICDPFAGSGSTVAAALHEWVRIIGVELDAEGEGHIEVGRARAAHAERTRRAP